MCVFLPDFKWKGIKVWHFSPRNTNIFQKFLFLARTKILTRHDKYITEKYSVFKEKCLVCKMWPSNYSLSSVGWLRWNFKWSVNHYLFWKFRDCIGQFVISRFSRVQWRGILLFVLILFLYCSAHALQYYTVPKSSPSKNCIN